MPARQAEVCSLWCPMPGGLKNQYLAASVHCLRSLAARFGHIEPWFFFDCLVWLYKDQSVFQLRAARLTDARVCAKQPQVLAEVKQNTIWKERQNPGPPKAVQVPRVEDNGAVVFVEDNRVTVLTVQPRVR